jgi:hypothetical protein
MLSTVKRGVPSRTSPAYRSIMGIAFFLSRTGNLIHVPDSHIGLATASTQIEERPLKILVIDDVEEVVNLLAEGLSLFNHTVHKALSGQEGLEIFMREVIDTISQFNI